MIETDIFEMSSVEGSLTIFGSTVALFDVSSSIESSELSFQRHQWTLDLSP